MFIFIFFFFFSSRRRHTRYWRDWSSDVCSSDLERQLAIPRSGRDIVIGEGAWVASNAMVLGPCTIGAHAVVGGGSLVIGDVAPYTIVAGVPAEVLRTIPHDDDLGQR